MGLDAALRVQREQQMLATSDNRAAFIQAPLRQKSVTFVGLCCLCLLLHLFNEICGQCFPTP